MHSFRRGFTLLELLGVLVILGILIALGFKGYDLARREALKGRTLADIENWKTALNEYRVEYGRVPQQEEVPLNLTGLPEFEVLKQQVSGTEWLDAWGFPYRYQSKGRYRAAIWSVGPDGLDGTPDDVVSGARDG